MNQKQRHFKYYEQLDTIKMDKIDEVNAAGATDDVIAWDEWWERRAQTNNDLIQAIINRNVQ